MIAAFLDYDPSIEGYRYIVLTSTSPVLETTTGGRHEEGWSRTDTRWELDSEAGTVTCTTDHDGQDCDGRLSSRYVQVCPVADLAAREPYHDDNEPPHPFRVPDWRERDSSRRDYAAEAAGY